MGLAVSVGNLAWFLKRGYGEDAEHFRHDLREVNRVLAANGLPAHIEPEVLPRLKDRSRLCGLPYSWLHYLRRAVAFARQAPDEFRPLAAGDDPTTDSRVDREIFVMMDSHLICHSDCEGYYVPIDFPDPLYDDRGGKLPGGILGSSQQAMRELLLTAPLLGIRAPEGVLADEGAAEIANEPERANPYWIERKVWLELFDRLSYGIEHKSAVSFG